MNKHTVTIEQITKDCELATLASACGDTQHKRLTINFKNGAIIYSVLGRYDRLINQTTRIDDAIEMYNSITGMEENK